MIKFDGFKIDVTAEEVEAGKNKSGPRLTPGEHELEILDAEYKSTVAADPTWHRFSLTLGLPGTQRGDDGKFKGTTFYSVMVPTVNIRYGEKGDRLGLFRMLQTFFDGVGEHLIPENVKDLVPAYFSDPKGLVGLKLKATLGYKKPYIDYADKQFFIKNPDGSLKVSGGFPNRESAEGQCFTDSIDIQKYIEVIRVHPGPKQREEKPKGKAKGKASGDW